MADSKEPIPFDPEKLFNKADEGSKKFAIETGMTLLRKTVMDIFDNNSLLSEEESIALAQDMLANGTGMKYDNLVRYWYSMWIKGDRK